MERSTVVAVVVCLASLGDAASLLAAAAPAAVPHGKPAPAPAAAEYRLAQEIKLGGDGGWDYLAVDSAARRLYVSHSTKVEVLDADKGTKVGEVGELSGVHGIAVAPALGRGFITNGRTNSVTIFDLVSLAKIAEVPVTGESPDAVLFEPVTGRVLAMNHRSGNVTAIDAATAKVAGAVEVGGTLEFAATDGGGTVFVNVEDRSEVAVIDARKLAVTARWPLAPCQEPTGMAIDVAHRRLFVVCGNAMAAVVDAEHGKVLQTIATGEGTDGAGFDATTGTAFSSNGEGTLTVMREDAPGRFARAQSVATRRGARTMAVDETTHRVFLSTAELGPPPAPTSEQPHPRPAIVPGTFEVLVVAPPGPP